MNSNEVKRIKKANQKLLSDMAYHFAKTANESSMGTPYLGGPGKGGAVYDLMARAMFLEGYLGLAQGSLAKFFRGGAASSTDAISKALRTRLQPYANWAPPGMMTRDQLQKFKEMSESGRQRVVNLDWISPDNTLFLKKSMKRALGTLNRYYGSDAKKGQGRDEADALFMGIVATWLRSSLPETGPGGGIEIKYQPNTYYVSGKNLGSRSLIAPGSIDRTSGSVGVINDNLAKNKIRDLQRREETFLAESFQGKPTGGVTVAPKGRQDLRDHMIRNINPEDVKEYKALQRRKSELGSFIRQYTQGDVVDPSVLKKQKRALNQVSQRIKEIERTSTYEPPEVSDFLPEHIRSLSPAKAQRYFELLADRRNLTKEIKRLSKNPAGNMQELRKRNTQIKHIDAKIQKLRSQAVYRPGRPEHAPAAFEKYQNLSQLEKDLNRQIQVREGNKEILDKALAQINRLKPMIEGLDGLYAKEKDLLEQYKAMGATPEDPTPESRLLSNQIRDIRGQIKRKVPAMHRINQLSQQVQFMTGLKPSEISDAPEILQSIKALKEKRRTEDTAIKERLDKVKADKARLEGFAQYRTLSEAKKALEKYTREYLEIQRVFRAADPDQRKAMIPEVSAAKRRLNVAKQAVRNYSPSSDIRETEMRGRGHTSFWTKSDMIDQLKSSMFLTGEAAKLNRTPGARQLQMLFQNNLQKAAINRVDAAGKRQKMPGLAKLVLEFGAKNFIKLLNNVTSDQVRKNMVLNSERLSKGRAPIKSGEKLPFSLVNMNDLYNETVDTYYTKLKIPMGLNLEAEDVPFLGSPNALMSAVMSDPNSIIKTAARATLNSPTAKAILTRMEDALTAYEKQAPPGGGAFPAKYARDKRVASIKKELLKKFLR